MIILAIVYYNKRRIKNRVVNLIIHFLLQPRGNLTVKKWLVLMITRMIIFYKLLKTIINFTRNTLDVLMTISFTIREYLQEYYFIDNC